MQHDIPWALEHLHWMRERRIWPNGKRYLWTDAFGVVLFVSLYRLLGQERWLEEAMRLVADVERVLGRPRGLRIGEAPVRLVSRASFIARAVRRSDPAQRPPDRTRGPPAKCRQCH
jgi:hypothetical protein